MSAIVAELTGRNPNVFHRMQHIDADKSPPKHPPGKQIPSTLSPSPPENSGTAVLDREILDSLRSLWEGPFGPENPAGVELGVRGFLTARALLGAQGDIFSIGGLERFAARGELNPVARALLIHLEFVTIHPFMDGNGRLGRLLMNHALLTAGLPWVTIRSDERVPFFRSIEKAQVDDEVGPFAEFLWHLIRQVVREVESRKAPRTRSRAARRTARRVLK